MHAVLKKYIAMYMLLLLFLQTLNDQCTRSNLPIITQIQIHPNSLNKLFSMVFIIYWLQNTSLAG